MKKQSDQVKKFRRAFKLRLGKFHPNNEILLSPEKNIQLHKDLIQEEVDELKEALDNNNIIEVADAIADIRYLLNGLELELNLQSYSEAIFDEVHASNMSKLDENGDPIYREDGKVLKSEKYFKPNIAKILNLE